MTDIGLPLLARQPILDHNLQVIGYELLCRPHPQDDAAWQESQGDHATSEVMIGAYQELGFEKVTGGLPAFVNFTRNWLFNPPVVSSNMLVAEVLEYVSADEDTILAIEQLRRMNYQIALDDFIAEPNQIRLLPYVDIVKVDILRLPDIQQLFPMIQAYQRPGLTWLAEKVETPEEYEECRKAGCTLFQGYFFAKPTTMYGKRLPDNKISVLQLLEQLNNPDAEIADISKTLQTEPQLSFRLLQLVNSAAVACAVEVTSIQQALMLVGLDKIKTWAKVLSLGQLSDKPEVLREQAVLRGFLTQELATKQTTLDSNTAFTLGLFSLLDAFLDLSMEEVCERLNLPQELSGALTHHKGKYGQVLGLVEEMERANWESASFSQLEELQLEITDITSSYQNALHASRDLLLSTKSQA
ncbi:EAL and HDOD domain-containing protein [Bacterioplanoides sp.]|uniref:EAL and HDOD domain-containing protein n=1 Tax=Bacterioplanoides sp. TaxID=2066072 RepID=UPI003B5C29F6